ncbi:hypothetical protein BRYFOR_09928 [Marvinbryantia formatexigens DSM 14469]|uniref:Uncharacterized protein n=1 Tax=Marvinbryantia formatexigens DSM 14469 TaxID=478749 RepID=C6LMM7_9FIRM|nr:hypothetical protein BRYFOR_09928 [Marvinbryantia formatexigens DSM 14469]
MEIGFCDAIDCGTRRKGNWNEFPDFKPEYLQDTCCRINPEEVRHFL